MNDFDSNMLSKEAMHGRSANVLSTDKLNRLKKNGLLVARHGAEEMMDYGLLTGMKFILGTKRNVFV